MKRFLSALLVVMMLVSMLPANVFAAETETVVLDLTSNAYRTEFDASTKAVYSNNGITLTNGKGSSNNPLREQGNGNTDTHIRLYAGTTLTVECEGMTQIVFSCPSADYATVLLNSINANSDPYIGFAAASGATVTVSFGASTDRLYVSSVTAQTRLTQVEVTKSVSGTETPACTHESTEESGYVAPGCTTPGMSATVTCTACGEVVTAGQEIAPTGHSYAAGVCTVCGEKEAATATAELSLANQTYRTSSTDTQQVYANDGITLTYNKGTYSNALRDNTGDDHLRLYIGTNFTVEFPMNITQIAFTCVSSYILQGDISGATVTTDGTVITVVLNTPATSFTVSNITKQSRINSLTVTYEVSEDVCLHEETTVEGYEAPTCTTLGKTGNTVCVACGEVLKESETLPVSHEGFETYVEDYIAPTCTEPGETGITYCENCDEIVAESEPIPATGHNYVNGVCVNENCGESEPSEPELTGYVLVTDVADITAGGEFVIVVNTGSSQLAMPTSLSSGKFSPVAVTIENGVVTTEDAPVWEVMTGTNGVALYNGTTYLSYGTSGTNFSTAAAPYMWSVEAADNNTFNVTSVATSSRGILYQMGTVNKFGAYAISNRTNTTTYVGSLEFYKLIEEEVDPNACTHELTEVTAGYPASCTSDGKEDTLSCACGQNVQEGAVIPAPGHSYDDDYCTVCKIINPEAAKQAASIDGMAADGDQVIFYHPGSKVAMAAAADGDRMGAVSVTKASGKIPYSATHTAVMTVEQVGDYYRFEMDGQYLTSGTTGNTLCFAALPAEGETDYTLWEVTLDSSYGVIIRSVNAVYNGNANQTIEYYNGKFYPYGYNASYVSSYRIQLGLVNKITLTEDVEEIVYEGKLNLDLNGFTANYVEADELVVWDSSATATTAGTGKLFTDCAVAVDNTVEGTRYIALKGEDGAYTFHVLQLKLDNVTLRTNKAGIYYKASMVCDQVLADQIDYHGVAVSIVGAPTADFENEENTAATKIYGAPESVFTSGSVTNIFRDSLSAEKNAARGEMAIYADSYIKLMDGTVLMGDNDAAKSLKDIMDYLNTNYASLSAEDQANALSFYETWADAMASWELVNLAAAIVPEA